MLRGDRIDFLFVDELHLFKNKTIITGVEGVSSAGARRATDLDSKLWYLQDANGARSIVGATATPIANAIAEAWTMQTYIQPDVLEESGLESFDGWAATFAQQVAAVELAPDGGSYRVTSRLARYQNVPELIGQFRRTADVRLREDLDLKLPRLRGGAPDVVVVPASAELDNFVQLLVSRAEAIRNGGVKPWDDNMLAVTGDGRKAALDLRLVHRRPDPEGGKLAAAAERIAGIYHDTRENAYLDDTGNLSPQLGAFQIVFCDLSTPKHDGRWNVYDELKHILVAEGIPQDEVAFIHDARNDETRAQLFARCRSGQIAVLIGSTEKMGVGTNIHTRAVALHHLDCPWRPADIEQREGRVIRQGNQNDEVRIFRYATEGSFDVYMWQTCERKAGFIGQLMRNEAVGRDLDEVDDATLSFAEVKALASGNPLIIEQAGIQADLAKLERLEFAHNEEQRRLHNSAKSDRESAGYHRNYAEVIDEAIKRRTDTTGDRFRIEIAGQRYTKRPEANAALGREIEGVLKELGEQPEWITRQITVDRKVIAKLGGFDVTLKGYRISKHKDVELVLSFAGPDRPDRLNGKVKLKESHMADRKFDLMKRLEHQVRRLDELREGYLARAREAEARAEALQTRLGEPFPHEERLAALRKRYQEILDVLNPDDSEADEAAPDAPSVNSGQSETTAIPPTRAAETAPPEPGTHPTSEGPVDQTPPQPSDPTRRLDDLKKPPDPDDDTPGLDSPDL